MNYTLHQLQVFIKVVEHRSVTKASEVLFLSQPAVSIQLKNFQEQFKIPLIEIIGRKVYITDFGEKVYHAAVKILNEVREINNQSLAYRGELFGQIKLSVVSTGKYLMPFFLSEFLNKHHGVELSMDVTNKFKVVESLEKNEVDFALVSMMPDQLKLDYIDLLDNVLIWVAGRDLAKADKFGLEDLKQQNLIFREEGSATRKQMERYIDKHNFMTFKRLELTSNEAVKQSVIAGLGVSLVPLIGLRNHLELGNIRYISTPDTPILTRWRLVWLKGKKFSPAAEQFLKYLETEKERLVQMHFGWYMNFLNKIN